MNSYRRVNRLHLHADNHEDILKASLLLEDALHTASFSGLPKHGLIFIRRLELGQISMTNNALCFSQRIEQLFLSAQPKVIRSGREEQPDAPIVWFADSVEPYVLLTHLLAQAIIPASWYWRLAVPEWTKTDAPRTDLARLIVSVSQASHGLMTVAAIIDALVTDGHIDHLIENLSPETTNLILTNIHIEHDKILSINRNDTQIIGKPVSLSRSWKNTLEKWLSDLDYGDSRSCLLVISLAIVYDFSRAEFIAAELLNLADKHPDFENKPEKIQSSEQTNKYLTAQWQDSVKANRLCKKNDEQIENIVDTNLVENKHLTDSMNLSGLYSHNCGLPMLINVLQRLQIHETLKQFPLLSELNLPNHILWACSDRSGVPSNDSICQWLTARYKLPITEQACEFVVPLFWFKLLFNQHRSGSVVLSRIRTDKENFKYRLFDSTGKIVLAIWQGKMPTSVNRLIADKEIKLLPPVQDSNDLQCIINTYLFAINRYLWRYAKTGLRNMVRQAGRVAITKTHLDIIFSLQQADVNRRKAGLDIDPGWVPWLARVIKFHYLEDELE